MKIVVNKKARHEYEIEDSLQAGIALSGAEVKSVRLGHASLTGSYVTISANEAFLLNVQINPYAFARQKEYDPKRTRKLLLHRKEIEKLSELQHNQGRVLVPLSLELVRNKIKVEVGVGKPLKKQDKREKLKKRDQQREIARQMKRY